MERGHLVTGILGPGVVAFPSKMRRVDVGTAREMYEAVMREWARHDLLVMAAAVADYRPKVVSGTKLARSGADGGGMSLELEATEDIVAAACAVRRADQRVVGFSLEEAGGEARAVGKMREKGLDMVVFNPLGTMGAAGVEGRVIWADGREVGTGKVSKEEFGRVLVGLAEGLFG